MRGGPPPPPGAMSLDHATAGTFVLFEQPLEETLVVSQRRLLLWDVGARQLQLARGAIEPDVQRRIAAAEVTRIHLRDAGTQSRVSVELRSGEEVDLVGAVTSAKARTTAELVEKVTRAALVVG